MNVQIWLAKDPSTDQADAYECVTCPACQIGSASSRQFWHGEFPLFIISYAFGGKSFHSLLQPIVKPLRNLAHNCGLTRHAISSTQICDVTRPLARLSRWWAVSGIQALAAPFSEAPSRTLRCFRMGICSGRCTGADCRNIDRQRMSPNNQNGRRWLQMPKASSRSKRRRTACRIMIAKVR